MMITSILTRKYEWKTNVFLKENIQLVEAYVKKDARHAWETAGITKFYSSRNITWDTVKMKTFTDNYELRNIIFNKSELSEIFSKVFRLKENETGYFFIIAKGHQVWNIWPILVFRNIIGLWKYTSQTYQHRIWLSLLCMGIIRMWSIMQFIDFLTVYNY